MRVVPEYSLLVGRSDSVEQAIAKSASEWRTQIV